MNRLAAYVYVADLVADQRVLEVQCGDGEGAAFLARCGARSVVAVDGDRARADRARRRHRLANLEVRCEDPARLELEDGSVDMIFVPEAARLLRRRDALDELRRVLARGGWLVGCAVSAERAGGAVGEGVSYHELGERLQPQFAPVRVAALSRFTGVAVCEYAAGGDPPQVQLDRTLVDPAAEVEVTAYVAICGGPAQTAPRGFTIVEIHTPSAGDVQRELAAAAARTAAAEDEAARWKDTWKQAERKNDEVWRKVGDVQRELDALREQTMENARKQRQQSQVDLARALEKGALEGLALQEKLAREQQRRAELERALEEAENARAALEKAAAEGQAEDLPPAGVERLVRDAEVTLLTVGLSSLQAKVREVAGKMGDAQRTLQGRSPDELLAFMARLEETLRGLA